MSSPTAPVWCDLTAAGDTFGDVLTAVLQAPIEGVLVRPEQAAGLALPPRVELCVLVTSAADADRLDDVKPDTVIAATPELATGLGTAARRGVMVEVTDETSMLRAVDLTALGTVVVSFRDTTNIPL
ncbi:MAG TPA: hypothetical protein VHV49_09180, partial [Pseudonocardiaceae bacterium]|nr:hypothetical protein [Pseudonocardiaceae bacterium]